jgi:hypothetical protein
MICEPHNNRIVFLSDDRENVIPILEKYFNMSKYKSFLRQLQAYGFQRALPNPKDDPCRDTKPKRDSYRGKWSHKLFRRDKMNLCNKMTRDGRAKNDRDRGDAKSKIISKKVVIVRSKDGVFGSPSSRSTQLRRTSPSTPNYLERIKKQEQHQKELAVMKQQQQQQQQQQLQLLHNRILQQQQHAPHAPPTGAFHHDPRYSQHHPSQVPPFHHPQHHLVQQRHNQQQQLQQQHAQQHPPRQGSPRQPGAPMPGSTPASLLSRVKQQQEEQQRQQLQMHIHHLEQQQLLSNILAARGEAPPPPGKAPSPLSIPSAATSAPTQATQTLLAGINYNTNKQPSPSSPQRTAPQTANSTTDAVSEAASELRRAELALVERRRRLFEAQEQAQKEAKAAVRAHSTTRGGGQPLTYIAQSSSAAAAQKLLMRHHTAECAKPSSVPSSENPSSRLASKETTGAINRLLGGLPLTSLLEDLDNAFKSSTMTNGFAPTQLQRDHSGGSKTVATSNNQHKITEEELLRARAQSTAAPSPMDHLVHRRPTSNANDNTGDPAPGDSSPGPSASERELIMARINAIEQIRMREQNQQQLQQAQARHNQQQQQQFLLKIGMAEREEHEKRSRMVLAGPSGVPCPPRSHASVRNAIRNAGVGLIGGASASGGSSKPMQGLPPSATLSGSIERINSPPSSSVLPPAQSVGALSKEMMDIFAQTAAAAMNSKMNIDSNSGSGGSGNTSEAASPPTIVSSSHSLRPPNASVMTGAASRAPNSEVIPPPAPISGDVGALRNGRASGSLNLTATLKPPSAAPIATTNQPMPPSFGIANSDLEAARAMMKIPGTVSQSTGEPTVGHWELVKPEELKKGAYLAKALPEVVTKSADLSYETYKSMAMKLTPPKVMRIPDGWDSLKEPVYLVVDPVNVRATSGTMATTASGSPISPPVVQGAPGHR